jgi:hypothetical protein
MRANNIMELSAVINKFITTTQIGCAVLFLLCLRVTTTDKFY